MNFKFAIFLLLATAAQSQPPVPVQPSPLGRQYPYSSISTVQATSVVATVYVVKFLRLIEVTTNSMETNFVCLRTNVVSVVTNSSPINPE